MYIRHQNPAQLRYGVQQGSVLGPIRFILYKQLIKRAIPCCPASHQMYVLQIMHTSEIAGNNNNIEMFISDVKDEWSTTNE